MRARDSRPATAATAAHAAGGGWWLGFALHGLGFALLYLGIAAALFGPAPRPPRLPAGEILSAAVTLAAALLVLATLRVFPSFRVRPRVDAGHELSVDGPFRLVRHPIYLALDLVGLGAFLWLATPTLAGAFAVVALAGDMRARVEERVLHAAFGEAYRRYARRTRRFIPGIY